MPASARTRNDDGVTSPELSVRAYEAAPGQFVFVEAANADGWIASDLTVRVPR